MPNIALPLTSISQSVTRPVVFDIITQLRAITNIHPDAQIYYPGDSGKMQTAGASIDGDNTRNPIFNNKRIVFIEVEDDYDVEAVGTTAINREEHVPVFLDQALGLVVTPVYATTNITINFKYRCDNKTEALKWRDDARMRASQLYEMHLHNIRYHYAIPVDVWTIVQEVHRKREANLPYGQSIVEYINSYASDRLTLVGDVGGKNVSLAVAETQARIQGIFGFDTIPEKPERDDSNGIWTVSFSYKFTYEKPIGCQVQYPIMVHNQLLDIKYIDLRPKELPVDRVPRSFSKSFYAMNGFESSTMINSVKNSEAVLRIPAYDSYVLPNVIPGTGTVMVALAEVDVDKKSLFNLRELGDVLLDDDVLTFITESEYPYLTKNYNSIVQLSLYRDRFASGDDSLVCDSDLNVSSKVELDCRRQHRVRLSLVVDLTYLTRAAIERLKKYPAAMVKIIGAMNELLRNHPDFTNLGDRPYISDKIFDEIYQLVTGYPYNGNGGKYGPNGHGMFDGIDPRIVENYRRNSMSRKTVMTSWLTALPF